jgi:glycosyltransferase involved in cell wall biosynthesis
MTVPVRVLLVVGSSAGGIGAHVAMLAADLADHHQMTVLGPATTLARPDFVPLSSHGVDLAIDPGTASIRSLIKNADVVHAHGFHAGLSMLIHAPISIRAKLVSSWHNQPPRGSMKQRFSGVVAARVLARGSRVTLGASDDLVRLARKLGARDARLFPVVAPPLAVPTATRPQLRGRFGVDDSRPVAVAVGRLAPQKDQATLIDAFALLADLEPSPVLLIAGDGPLEQDLQGRIDASGASVRLLGRRDDVADLLAVADLAVNSSTWEARALVAQEALRQGVPFVGTAVGGVPGLVGEAALLVPPGDPAALAAACRQVLTDGTTAARLKIAGPAQAATWPDRQAAAAMAHAIYAEIADHDPDDDTPGR